MQTDKPRFHLLNTRIPSAFPPTSTPRRIAFCNVSEGRNHQQKQKHSSFSAIKDGGAKKGIHTRPLLTTNIFSIMLKTLRRILAVIMFVLVTFLFVDVTGFAARWFSWAASLQFIPALLALNVAAVAVVIVATLLFGRLYCSVVCPLGIFQDIVSHIRNAVSRRFGKRHFYTFHRALPWLRWSFFALFLAALVAGIMVIPALLEPYSAYGRMATNLLAPLYSWGNNLLAAAAASADSYAFSGVECWYRGNTALLVSVVTFAIVGIFALDGRTYCNSFCPVGTLLGFISRWSWFKIRVDESRCNHCGACSRFCKSHCIDSPNSVVDASRCVVCGNCLGHCRQGALQFSRPLPKAVAAKTGTASSTTPDNASETSRRAFLITTATMAAGAAMAQAEKKVDGGLAVIEDKTVPERRQRILPPGAESEGHLHQHCTACQLCISQCPNGVLRPSTDFSHFMQPEMGYEHGYCRPECNRCGEVCPNNAIRLVDLAEKCSTKIGTARVIRENCLMNERKLCGNCAHHCPAGAISIVPLNPDDETPKYGPVVDAERCIGCGACENLCPVRPISAIIVDGIQQQRTI